MKAKMTTAKIMVLVAGWFLLVASAWGQASKVQTWMYAETDGNLYFLVRGVGSQNHNFTLYHKKDGKELAAEYLGISDSLVNGRDVTYYCTEAMGDCVWEIKKTWWPEFGGFYVDVSVPNDNCRAYRPAALLRRYYERRYFVAKD